MANKEFVSLNELAKISNINKSKLTYYVGFGLIVPETVVGRMQIFKKTTTINTLKKIQDLQLEGMSLQHIKEKLYETTKQN